MPKLAADHRRNELAQIHIAKAQLGMAEDVYRDMLWTIGRVRSAADLDWAGRKKVLDHMVACGWKKKPATKARKPVQARTRKLADDDQSKMIRGLWLELHAAGTVRDPSEAALASFVKRHARVDALQWLTVDQASRIIEHLKKWRNRTATPPGQPGE